MHLELPSLDMHAVVHGWQLQMHGEEFKVDLFFTCVRVMIQYQCYVMIRILVMAFWCNVAYIINIKLHATMYLLVAPLCRKN